MINVTPAFGAMTATECTHEITVKRTLNVSATCETTADFCTACGARVTPEITDCR